MSARNVHACLRASLSQWAGSVGTQTAADETGISAKSIRRKRDEGYHWTDAEIAAAIAHEVETTGSSTIVTELLTCTTKAPEPALSEGALRSRLLRVGAEISALSAAIQSRMADGEASPRDAAVLGDASRQALRDLRVMLRDCETYARRWKQG